MPSRYCVRCNTVQTHYLRHVQTRHPGEMLELMLRPVRCPFYTSGCDVVCEEHSKRKIAKHMKVAHNVFKFTDFHTWVPAVVTNPIDAGRQIATHPIDAVVQVVTQPIDAGRQIATHPIDAVVQVVTQPIDAGPQIATHPIDTKPAMDASNDVDRLEEDVSVNNRWRLQCPHCPISAIDLAQHALTKHSEIYASRSEAAVMVKERKAIARALAENIIVRKSELMAHFGDIPSDMASKVLAAFSAFNHEIDDDCVWPIDCEDVAGPSKPVGDAMYRESMGDIEIVSESEKEEPDFEVNEHDAFNLRNDAPRGREFVSQIKTLRRKNSGMCRTVVQKGGTLDRLSVYQRTRSGSSSKRKVIKREKMCNNEVVAEARVLLCHDENLHEVKYMEKGALERVLFFVTRTER
ncbi:hypothetical protein CAPTEDRAFT_197607 [Capitella teleta]|uniref:Uncharacterized protein n=1 Tax=Capitella teleta TaxID=283909 RepID=R7TQ93_CAPTE|nr:hypothetical protein CAPTEDRAFT_197607 [Capitella teleta]|eukprot:ELT96078.1 hypothetical protein CAPTEDRAFT_197607 [Capitella teleta]